MTVSTIRPPLPTLPASSLEAPLIGKELGHAVIPRTSPQPRPATHSLLINPSGADPWVTSYGGLLYYTQTTGRDVRIWVGEDLRDLVDATPLVLWDPPGTRSKRLKNLWAPEIHMLNGAWYLYVAADDGHNHNHRMYVLESRDGPVGPYELIGKISVPGEDRWAIDGTVTTINGELYYAWSGWPATKNGRQNLYLSRMKNPWTLAETATLISQPEHGWESWINEGPQFLHRESETFIVYSANRSWTDEYRLGLLRLHGENPLASGAWSKTPEPVFDSVLTGNHPIYAPGHCSFYTDPNEHEWILYHVAKRKGSGWKREVRAQQWRWTAAGEPDFGVPCPVAHTTAEDFVTYRAPPVHLPTD